jgi:hypothetical protein
MKYEQPFGVSDPNASYINGNPSTGTMGSIPPAASIENPQREIVNLITDAGLVPADSDLHQLARGVQSGHLNYAVDAGTPNALAINVTPPLLAYAAGQRWTVKVFATNTGPSVININSLGARHIVYPGGTELKGGELHAGGLASLVDDGTNLQLSNASAGAGGLLTAPKTYYVNAATGDDSLYDGTTATVSGTHGPFATHQRALAAAYTWNQNGFGITIQTADGTYPPFRISQPPNGVGGIYIAGNIANAANCIIRAASGEAIMLQAANGYALAGFALQSDARPATPFVSAGLRVEGCTLFVRNLQFNACQDYHIFASTGSLVSISGAEGGSPGDYITVAGDAPYHMYSYDGSVLNLGFATLYTVGNRTFGVWAQAAANGIISSHYASMSIGGTVNCQRYNCVLNGVINTYGMGINYFPGAGAGTLVSGGQYG